MPAESKWKSFWLRAAQSASRLAKPGLLTSLDFGKAIVPAYVVVALLRDFGLLTYLTGALRPLMGVLGLSPDCAVPLVAGYVVGLYAGAGGAAALHLTVKEMTILGTMLGISHSLVLEGAIVAKAGASAWLSTLVRLLGSLVAAMLLNLAWGLAG